MAVLVMAVIVSLECLCRSAKNFDFHLRIVTRADDVTIAARMISQMSVCVLCRRRPFRKSLPKRKDMLGLCRVVSGLEKSRNLKVFGENVLLFCDVCSVMNTK